MKKIIIRLFNLINITYPYLMLMTYLSWFTIPFIAEFARSVLKISIAFELVFYVYPALGVVFFVLSIINKKIIHFLFSILLIFAFPITMIIGYLLLGV